MCILLLIIIFLILKFMSLFYHFSSVMAPLYLSKILTYLKSWYIDSPMFQICDVALHMHMYIIYKENKINFKVLISLCWEKSTVLKFLKCNIYYFVSVGLLLLCFEEKDILKPHYHMKPSIFLYPDEKTIQGSIRLCNALIIQCHKREKFPVCRMVTRKNEPPKFVVLVPQV